MTSDTGGWCMYKDTRVCGANLGQRVLDFSQGLDYLCHGAFDHILEIADPRWRSHDNEANGVENPNCMVASAINLINLT